MSECGGTLRMYEVGDDPVRLALPLCGIGQDPCDHVAEWAYLWTPYGPGSEIEWHTVCECHLASAGEGRHEALNLAELLVVGVTRPDAVEIPGAGVAGTLSPREQPIGG